MIDKDMLEAMRMREEMEPIKQDLADVKQRTTKIEFTLEHDVSKQLQLLTEGQQGMNDKFKKLDQVAEDVEEIKTKVTMMMEVVGSCSPGFASQTLVMKETSAMTNKITVKGLMMDS